MGERGPKPSGLVELRTSITAEMERALGYMVQISGVSKSTLVREALALYLVTLGSASPGMTEDINPRRTGGRGLVSLRNKKGTKQ